jgi:hypothetical protein
VAGVLKREERRMKREERRVKWGRMKDEVGNLTLRLLTGPRLYLETLTEFIPGRWQEAKSNIQKMHIPIQMSPAKQKWDLVPVHFVPQKMCDWRVMEGVGEKMAPSSGGNGTELECISSCGYRLAS